MKYKINQWLEVTVYGEGSLNHWCDGVVKSSQQYTENLTKYTTKFVQAFDKVKITCIESDSYILLFNKRLNVTFLVDIYMLNSNTTSVYFNTAKMWNEINEISISV